VIDYRLCCLATNVRQLFEFVGGCGVDVYCVGSGGCKRLRFVNDTRRTRRDDKSEQNYYDDTSHRSLAFFAARREILTQRRKDRK
jgi:hypothetical protein